MEDLKLLHDSARHGSKDLLVVGAGKEIIASIPGHTDISQASTA